MEDEQTLSSWLGHTALDRDGEPLGRVEELYLDEESDAPKWALLASAERPDDPPFVPLEGVQASGATLRLTVDRQAALSSPRVRAQDGVLAPSQEEELERHYAAPRPAGAAPTEVLQTVDDDADVHDGPVEMVRSEEELVVTKRTVPRERVRFVKRIVTETVTRTVEVRREELHVERLPPDAAAPPGDTSGTPFAEEPMEIILMEEEVVITTRVVPRERVRLIRETVVGEEKLTAALRSERVELERDVR
jgi:uncharacterized protein (TIGR02271 family)